MLHHNSHKNKQVAHIGQGCWVQMETLADDGVELD